MDCEEILKDYYSQYDKERSVDEKHLEDGTLSRKKEGLPPRPLSPEQTKAVIELLLKNVRSEEMLDLLLNRVVSGTNHSAKVKALFLGQVVLENVSVQVLSPEEAVFFLGSMKGGHNIPVLISLLRNDKIAPIVVGTLSELVLIHNALEEVIALCDEGNKYAPVLLECWGKAEWFTKKKALEDETQLIVFKIPDEIEASTDFLSHSKGGHTRTDTPFHAKHYFMNQELLTALDTLKANNPETQVVLVADKIGTSSSRKSGMNNVEYKIGIENEQTRFQPDKKTRAIIFAGSVLGPIFAKTAEDMGSIIIRTKTENFATGDKICVRWKKGEILDDTGALKASFTPLSQTALECVRVGGGANLRMGKILTKSASKACGRDFKIPYPTEEKADDILPMTAAQKVIAKASGLQSVSAGQTVYASVDTVASQDTTGGMTVQELQETLSAMKLSVPLFLQTQCHNAALGFRNETVVNTNKKLTDFVKEMGGVCLEMGDGIIHSWLNDMVVPDTIVVGGDSHTRTPTALSFPLGSGGIAEAAATGITEIVVPPSVLVRLSGDFNQGITVRDLVNYIAYKGQKQFGKNIFEGTIIEFQRNGTSFEMIDVFKLTNASAERSAAAAYFELPVETKVAYIKEKSLPLIEKMQEEGYDNASVLSQRKEAFERYCEAPVSFKADENAAYAYTLDVDLSEITEPYIACPHTPDNVKPLSELAGTPVEFCFLGSCMSGEKDFEAFNRMVSESQKVLVETWAATPTRMITQNLALKGVVKSLISKGVRVEVSGCSLCMGNQERVKGKKNVLSTSTRNFKGRMGDEASVYLVSAELEAVSCLMGKFPTVDEYFKAIK